MSAAPAAATSSTGSVGTRAVPGRSTRRTYDNTRRRQQAADTRQRIVTAGSQLLHTSSVRDWSGMTIRAVADSAGVNERTVYRHFENERNLRDAVMHELEQEAGIELDGIGLNDIGAFAGRIFRHVSSFPARPEPALDPTLTATKTRLHTALRAAVAGDAPRWSEEDHTLAAAMLDLLSSVGAYERLVGDWGLTPAQATAAAGWVIAMVGDAVRAGRRPDATR